MSQQTPTVVVPYKVGDMVEFRWWMYPWEPAGFYDPHIVPDLGIVINIFDHAITHEWEYAACWVGVYVFKSPYGNTGYFEDTHYKFKKISDGNV